MNKNAQSETKEILARTLFDLLENKPFSKITVNELCEKSDIVRSTFYLHFRDKYELLSYCLDQIFYNIFEADANEELVEMFYQFISRYVTQCLEEKMARGALLPGPIECVASFYVSGFVGMTSRWIRSNYRIPKEVLASCQYKLMKDIL